jgi:ubiquinone/menaquinone biosynthesis C-methylase UbiE
MDRKYANYLLKKTRRDYNRIAPLFTIKRAKLTPDILYLKKYAQNNDKILDLGCGYGRLWQLFAGKKIEYLGTDNSKKQIEIAKSRFPDARFIKSDSFLVPVDNNYFDKIFCLSVIHHLPSVTYRLKILKEIERVLKPEGKLIITAWSVWQNPKIKKIMLKYKIRKLFRLSPMDDGDIFIPFKNEYRELLANRYLHCFKKDELRDLVRKAGFKILETKVLKRDRSGENKNILIIAQK